MRVIAIIKVFLLAAVLGLAAPLASAQGLPRWQNADELIAHLDALYAAGEHNAAIQDLFAFTREPNGPALYSDTIAWLDSLVFKRGAPTDYFIAVVPLIWLARNNPVWFNELAMQMYWAGRIRKLDMAARCDDTGVEPLSFEVFEAQSAPVVRWFGTLPLDVRKKVVEAGIQAADRLTENEYDHRACASGSGYYRNYFTQHHGVKFADEPMIDPKTGEKMWAFAADSLPPSGMRIEYDPELVKLVDDEEWARRKGVIREEALQSLSE